MKTKVVSVFSCALFCIDAFAFQTELNFQKANSTTDTTFSVPFGEGTILNAKHTYENELDTTSKSASMTYYFKELTLSDTPWAEAGFLQRSGHLSINFSSSNTETQNKNNLLNGERPTTFVENTVFQYIKDNNFSFSQSSILTTNPATFLFIRSVISAGDAEDPLLWLDFHYRNEREKTETDSKHISSRQVVDNNWIFEQSLSLHNNDSIGDFKTFGLGIGKYFSGNQAILANFQSHRAENGKDERYEFKGSKLKYRTIFPVASVYMGLNASAEIKMFNDSDDTEHQQWHFGYSIYPLAPLKVSISYTILEVSGRNKSLGNRNDIETHSTGINLSYYPIKQLGFYANFSYISIEGSDSSNVSIPEISRNGINPITIERNLIIANRTADIDADSSVSRLGLMFRF